MYFTALCDRMLVKKVQPPNRPKKRFTPIINWPGKKSTHSFLLPLHIEYKKFLVETHIRKIIH